MHTDENKEWIIERKKVPTWRKHLNQWKHQYDYEIVKIVHHNMPGDELVDREDEVTIYMWRRKK